MPLGNKAWFRSIGISNERIVELDWWQNREYSPQDIGHDSVLDGIEDTVIRITCVPAQHTSGRGALDKNRSLWSGWIIEQLLVPKDKSSSSEPRRRGVVYHAGDTGYRRTAKSNVICPVFKEIGERFGPVDLSFIPIWRGGSLGFISYMGLRLSHQDIPSALHTNPADAIDIHKDVKSLNTIGIHFGTFIGSENESYEAIIDFEEAREEQEVHSLDEEPSFEHGRSGILDIGGSFAVKIVD